MSQNLITIDDFSARIYTITGGGETLDDYYKTVFLLSDFLKSSEWKSSVSGFYLNAIKREPYNYTVRIAYMVNGMTSQPVECYQAYALRKKLVTAGYDELKPPAGLYTDYYGGDELAFRRYLATYSWIGIDLLRNGFEESTRLFSDLRKQPRATYRPFLESFFLDKSPYFSSLTKGEQAEFWAAFVSWPKSSADWAHMMVNMMIGRDQKSVD